MQLIYETLRGLGLTSKYQGYQQLAEATKIVLEHEDFMLNVTKNIYPEVALRVRTTPQSVERIYGRRSKYAGDRPGRRASAGYPAVR